LYYQELHPPKSPLKGGLYRISILKGGLYRISILKGGLYRISILHDLVGKNYPPHRFEKNFKAA